MFKFFVFNTGQNRLPKSSGRKSLGQVILLGVGEAAADPTESKFHTFCGFLQGRKGDFVNLALRKLASYQFPVLVENEVIGHSGDVVAHDACKGLVLHFALVAHGQHFRMTQPVVE